MDAAVRYRVSKSFIAAVKLASEPAYRIAQRAGLHPSTLSKLMSGAEPVRRDDRRVAAVARAMGLAPEECLEEVPGVEL